MAEPKDVYDFLEALRKENKKEFQNYNSFMEYFEEKARKNNVPISGQFELTPLCNLDCKMCYVHLNNNQLQGRELLGTEDWKALMKQAYDCGMMDAALTGGECLTYPGFKDIFLFLQDLGCQVTVMTNGFLLNEEMLDFFTEHPPSDIQVTLYGENDDVYERVTGRRAFGTVYKNLQRVKEIGIPLIITVTPNEYLGEDVFETIRVALSITPNVLVNNELFVPEDQPWRKDNVKDLTPEFYVRIFRFYQEMRGKETKTMPISELPAPGGKCTECAEKGIECGGGRCSFMMNWKGELCICNRLEARAYPLRDGFAQAWKEINEVALSWPRVPECQGCAYEPVCTRCAATKMKNNEPGKQPKELCEQVRYMVSQGVLSVSHCNI